MNDMPPAETPAETIARLEREAQAHRNPNAIQPLVPRPIVTVIALGVLLLLGWHIYYDASSADYENWQVTILLGSLVFFVLGADVSKWLRGGGRP